ncbi:4-phosphoerythronate dehydrogenase [Thiomicrospira microaerophila]|uniref:4-phosphoerythronate dehydrogenase n=1 Tax=Thiomicrospira microaerophila TaxID=406020 RepID=UPI00200E2F5B|nr:4-phosphoerythronate dehydrogenase [Thiomicrospira microaerophila]UQB41350.1 4-phosphoerythronate dehydrogenase [Thiomicrospira microaerophila]
MPQKTLIIDDAIPYAEAIFSHLGQIKLIPGRDINSDTVKQADAIIIRSRTQVNAALLDTSPVRFVGSTVVGLDHIDQAWLSKQGIHFYSAQGCNANSVAEYVINGLLEIAEQKNWILPEMTLGIVGVGHVGRLVNQKAKILGIRTLLNDPPRARCEGKNDFCSLESLLKEADIITLHTPLTKTGSDPTFHLLNENNLKLIKPNGMIINAARGGIIDEQAWLKINNSANIIDCWQNEPNISAELYFKADIATAHIAGHSLEAKVAGSEMVYRQLCQFWQIEPKTDWKQQLPPAPTALEPVATDNEQRALYQIIKQTYDLRLDDQAIRSPDINQVRAGFELHRRQYPIRREWALHKLKKTPNKRLNQTLEKLGFMLY